MKPARKKTGAQQAAAIPATSKTDRHIEIVRSGIPSLSSLSQESCDSIYAVLSQHYARVGITTVNSLLDLDILAARGPDLVFLGMKFLTSGQDTIWLGDYLDERGIAYTGSGSSAHKLEFDKALAKQRALDNGLATAPFYVALQGQFQPRTNMPLNFPLFIKPTSRGGGAGIDSASVANNFTQLEAKISSITTDFQSDSLVEEYLTGREFSVAVLKDEYSETYSALPIELIAQPDTRGGRLLSNQVKTTNSEVAIKVTDKIIETKVISLALKVFHALGARDYGRIDIRFDETGTAHFLEANLIPSLIGGYGSFPKACVLNAGLGYEDMIVRITELGLARSLGRNEPILEPGVLNITSLTLLNPILEPI